MTSAEYCQTAPQAMRNASTMVPTQTALTVAFCSLRPKKNMMAAPKAGSSGISQMWDKNIRFSVLSFSVLSKRRWLKADFLPLQQIHFVDVHRLLIAEEGN